MTTTRDVGRYRRAAFDRLTTVRHNLRVEGAQIVRIVIAIAVSWQLCCGSVPCSHRSTLCSSRSSPCATRPSRRSTCQWRGWSVSSVGCCLLLPTNPARAFTRALHDVATTSSENLLLASDLLSTEPEATAGGDESPHDELAKRLEAQSSRVDGQARTLPSRLAAAQRAVRLHPRWRRRHTQQLVDLVRPTGAAAELAELVRAHVADTVELSTRADAQDWRSTAAPLTRAVALPLAEAVTAGLTGEPNREALDRASSALQAHMTADPTRLGAVIRRPLRRIITPLPRLTR